MKFEFSLPLNAIQGSHSAAPMGRDRGNITQGSQAEVSSSVDDAIWDEWWEGWECGTYPIHSEMSTVADPEGGEGGFTPP